MHFQIRKEMRIIRKKNQALEEPFSVQHDLTNFMQSPLGVGDKEVLVPQETETHTLRIKLRDSEFRLQSEMHLTSPLSQSGSKPGITLEIPSQLYSPTDLKRELSSSSRRPAFTKFHMKSLDYEDDGQDFVEDLLKNMKEDQANHNNATPRDEQATCVIKSGEKENEDLNIKTMKGGMCYTTEVWPPETNNEEKDHKDEEVNDDKEMPHNSNPQNLQSISSKKSDQINLSFWEYIRSKFSRSEVIKEKMYIINEGIERINERLDIFNLFKKLREFDKLKVLLLENEQFVLFDSLHKPELALKASDVASTSNLPSRHTIKDAQFIQEKKKKDLILEYYSRLKHKEMHTALDKKLVNIYEDIFYVGSRDL